MSWPSNSLVRKGDHPPFGMAGMTPSANRSLAPRKSSPTQRALRHGFVPPPNVQAAVLVSLQNESQGSVAP